jgi:hypothetical protein
MSTWVMVAHFGRRGSRLIGHFCEVSCSRVTPGHEERDETSETQDAAEKLGGWFGLGISYLPVNVKE